MIVFTLCMKVQQTQSVTKYSSNLECSKLSLQRSFIPFSRLILLEPSIHSKALSVKKRSYKPSNITIIDQTPVLGRSPSSSNSAFIKIVQ